MSDKFKFGTWYPIETAMDEWGQPPAQEILTWVICPWGPGTWKGDAADWKGYKKDNPEASATHWMPLPPGPEEMAAKPDLEAVVRREMKFMDGVASTQGGSQRAINIAHDTANYLKNMLKEAGLE